MGWDIEPAPLDFQDPGLLYILRIWGVGEDAEGEAYYGMRMQASKRSAVSERDSCPEGRLVLRQWHSSFRRKAGGRESGRYLPSAIPARNREALLVIYSLGFFHPSRNNYLQRCTDGALFPWAAFLGLLLVLRSVPLATPLQHLRPFHWETPIGSWRYETWQPPRPMAALYHPPSVAWVPPLFRIGTAPQRLRRAIQKALRGRSSARWAAAMKGRDMQIRGIRKPIESQKGCDPFPFPGGEDLVFLGFVFLQGYRKTLLPIRFRSWVPFPPMGCEAADSNW